MRVRATMWITSAGGRSDTFLSPVAIQFSFVNAAMKTSGAYTIAPMTKPDAIAESRPLDYAPAPSARHRWMRRIQRWGLALLVLTTIAVSIHYGPVAWKRYQLLQLQEANMTAELPQDRPVWEEDLAAAAALMAAYPGEYQRDDFGRAMRIDGRWSKFIPELKMRLMSKDATTFLHERFTPSGQRRRGHEASGVAPTPHV